MYLYLLSQDENDGYDTYDAMVVAAESEYAAIRIHPDNDWGRKHDTWCKNHSQVKVKLIGIAKDGQEEGVILGSFNAG